jgi:hypothetical protein
VPAALRRDRLVLLLHIHLKIAFVAGHDFRFSSLGDPDVVQWPTGVTLTAGESGRVFNSCDSPAQRPVVWTLLDTGLPASELSGLTSKDVRHLIRAFST